MQCKLTNSDQRLGSEDGGNIFVRNIAALYQTVRQYITEDCSLKIQPSPVSCEWIYIFWLQAAAKEIRVTSGEQTGQVPGYSWAR
jgi:hypothetical protein